MTKTASVMKAPVRWPTQKENTTLELLRLSDNLRTRDTYDSNVNGSVQKRELRQDEDQVGEEH